MQANTLTETKENSQTIWIFIWNGKGNTQIRVTFWVSFSFFFLITDNFIALIAVNNSLGIQFYLVSLVVNH
jgi:hypothetical protein